MVRRMHMGRRIAAAAALVLALTSCAAEDAQPGDEASAEPGAQPSTEPAPTADEPLPCVPGTEPFTGAAAEQLGAEQVMVAYCMLADLALAQEKTSLALPVPEQQARDLDGVRALLTPTAARRWPAMLRDRASRPSPVDGLTLHDVRRVPAGYQRADDGPYVFGTKVGPATAEVRDGALALTFDLETGLVLEERGDDTGRHSLLPVVRTGTYVLVLDGDQWQVDDWEATFEHGEVRLVSG